VREFLDALPVVQLPESKVKMLKGVITIAATVGLDTVSKAESVRARFMPLFFLVCVPAIR